MYVWLQSVVFAALRSTTARDYSSQLEDIDILAALKFDHSLDTTPATEEKVMKHDSLAAPSCRAPCL